MNQEEMLTQIMTAVSGIQNEISTMNKRLDQMDERLDQMDERFDQVDKRFDQVDKRFNKMEKSIAEVKEDTEHTRQIVTRMEIEHGKKLDVLFDADTRDHEKIVEDIIPHLEKHDKQIDKMEQHILSLRKAK